MTENSTPCPACAAQTPDGLLCKGCRDQLRDNLLSIAQVWPDLEIVMSRQSRRGGGGKRTDSSPMPLDVRAMKVYSYVRNQLQTWVRLLELGDLWYDQRGCWCEPYRACKGWRRAPLPDEPRAWAIWLSDRTERCRGHEAAGEIAAEFAYCWTLVRRVIDLAAEMLYCGSCDTCGGMLYARPDSESTICRKCERAGVITLPVDVMKRREAMKAQAEDSWVTMDELLTAIPGIYGVRIVRGTVESWVSRGRLVKHNGRFRVGDVLDLAHGEMKRRMEDPAAARVGT